MKNGLGNRRIGGGGGVGRVREAESEGKGVAGSGSFERARSGRNSWKSPQQKRAKGAKPRRKYSNNRNAFT